MSSGSSSASERVHRHTTTTLNAVFAAKHPGAELQVEDIHWWSNGQKFSAATGRPWRCDECRSKSCCYYQAFDQISYAEATSPHHVFQKPIWVISKTDAALEENLNKQLSANTTSPSDELLDKLIDLEDKLDNQRLYAARRAGNINTKLQVLAYCAHQRTATHPEAKALRDTQASRAVRRRPFAARRAKRQKTHA
jgi:hypothetical protein